MPDRVFRQISLGDSTPEVAKRFVINHLDADSSDAISGEVKLTPSQQRKDLGELDECIQVLGGRLTDLEFLARRVKAGETPNRKWILASDHTSQTLTNRAGAVEEIVEQSASEILKMYLLDVDKGQHKWSPQQAWLLVKELAKHESLRYNEVLLSDTYKSDGETVLQALEQAELITVLSANGRPHAIRPGKPVYTAAFQQLTADRVLSAHLDLAIYGELTKLETQSIDKCESELALLGGLPGSGKGVDGRVRWLLAKVQASQAKIEDYERRSADLKSVLKKEY